jgi:hypothetical protein
MFLFRFFRNVNRTDKKRNFLITELDDLINLTKKEYDILTKPIEDNSSSSSSSFSLFPSQMSTGDPTTKENRITSMRTMANEKLESIR